VDPEGYGEEGSGDGHHSPWGPRCEAGGSSTGSSRLWRRAFLSIGAPLRNMGGGSVHLGGLWKRGISLYGRTVRGTWRGAPLLGTLKVM